ncbi:archease [Acetobacterium paludosum]|uniref:Archease n=1 Tax=Acetobacterium paludosum TaxID=52693 RepID=A0A923HWV9_9FIRM|nr:chemotaxis protein CheD [Acetobacterium paludosum]MBC3889786.1 archease [Acetobacterium paludosum]
MNRIIGIGEMTISNDINDTIKTFALASCVGITAYSAVRRVGGLIHIALPNPSSIEEIDARRCFYASTGIPFFIKRMCQEYGCSKGELIINIFGGANSIMKSDAFYVGRRNIEMTNKILNELNLKIHFSETGGNVSRTVELDVATGEINIWHQNIII